LVQGRDTAVQSRGSAEVLGTSAKPTATIFPVALVTILFGAVPDMLKRPNSTFENVCPVERIDRNCRIERISLCED